MKLLKSSKIGLLSSATAQTENMTLISTRNTPNLSSLVPCFYLPSLDPFSAPLLRFGSRVRGGWVQERVFWHSGRRRGWKNEGNDEGDDGMFDS